MSENTSEEAKGTKHSGSNSWIMYTNEHLRNMKVAQAKKIVHQEVLAALSSLIRNGKSEIPYRGDALYVAFATSQLAFKDGPIVAATLVHEQNVQQLRVLCATCTDPLRIQLLLLLYKEGACSSAVLAEASTIAEEELPRHLKELYQVHLLYQPEPKIYALTTHGRYIVNMLFWCAVKAYDAELLEEEQRQWFD